MKPKRWGRRLVVVAALAAVGASCGGCSGGGAGRLADASSMEAGTLPRWLPNVRVNDDQTPEQQREVSLTVDSRGNWYATWMDLRYGLAALNYCAFAGSRDGGRTWSANELYQGPNNVCGDPVVAADKYGNIYRMVISADFHFFPEGPLPVSSYILVSRSVDGGLTFDAWRTAVAPNPPGAIPPAGLNDKHWMAVDGDTVVVAWSILHRFLLGDVAFIRSDDGGTTWSPRRILGQGVGACVIIDGSGRIHAAWGNDVSQKVQYTRSADGGATWTPVRDVSDIGPAGRAGTDDTSLIIGCAADRSGQNVYLQWTGDLGSGSFDVWVVHSGDAGASWGAPTRVNDDTNNARQTRGWIAVDSRGVAHVAWADWRSGVARAYASRSQDRGSTWAQNEMISDGGGTDSAQDYNGLAVAPNDEVGFAWTDDRSARTGMDVYFSKSPYAPGP